MGASKGKIFEQKFREDWKKCFPGTFLYRVPDQQSGYGGGVAKNICDFIAFTNNKLFLIECKSHLGKSIPFTALSQLDILNSYNNCADVVPIFIIWFQEADKIIAITAEEAKKIKDSKSASIGLRHLDKYKILTVPAIKKRVYLEADYTKIIDWID